MLLGVFILTLSCPSGRFISVSSFFPAVFLKHCGKLDMLENTIHLWSSCNTILCFIIHEKAFFGWQIFNFPQLQYDSQSDLKSLKEDLNQHFVLLLSSNYEHRGWNKSNQSKILKCLKCLLPVFLISWRTKIILSDQVGVLSGQNLSLACLFAGLYT